MSMPHPGNIPDEPFGNLFAVPKNYVERPIEDPLLVLEKSARTNVESKSFEGSDPSNFSSRINPSTGKAPVSDAEAAEFVDTFLIHDPGFYDPSDPGRSAKLERIDSKRKFEITVDELTIKDKKKSAHYTMDYDGKIYQHLQLWQRGWHAGKSNLYGRSSLNNTSIGIEVLEPFEDIQYASLALLIREVADVYTKIDPTRIVGHYQVSPTRKTDPRNFDWWKLYTYLFTL